MLSASNMKCICCEPVNHQGKIVFPLSEFCALLSQKVTSAVPSTRSPPALPMRIAPGHPASRTPTPTAVTV